MTVQSLHRWVSFSNVVPVEVNQWTTTYNNSTINSIDHFCILVDCRRVIFPPKPPIPSFFPSCFWIIMPIFMHVYKHHLCTSQCQPPNRLPPFPAHSLGSDVLSMPYWNTEPSAGRCWHNFPPRAPTTLSTNATYPPPISTNDAMYAGSPQRMRPKIFPPTPPTSHVHSY